MGKIMKKMNIGIVRTFLLVFVCFMVSGYISNDKVFAAKEAVPERMKLVAETDTLELYLDEEKTDIAVKVKATEDIWFSNPIKAEEDENASDYYKKLMNSQFSIRYYNQNVQASEMDNYNDCILDGQFEIEHVENGVCITYHLGASVDGVVLPQIISEERFLLFQEKMDEKDVKKINRNYTFLSLDTMKENKKEEYLQKYPTLETNNLYVLKESTKDYMKEELMEFFAAAGYTSADMEKDNTENGFEASVEKPWFEITLEYTLEGDQLVVEMDPEKISYDTEKYYLVDIDLLEYFGAAHKGEEGYIFVPDGSGALIHFDNNDLNASAYIAQVYGQDLTNNTVSEKKAEIDQDVTVKMPVYGLVSGESAWFAIIEEGAAYADINAETSGRTNSYNNVYSGFSYLSYGAIALGDMVGTNSFQMYSSPNVSEKYRIRFSFLNGENADYVGMAHCYQNYLEEQGILTKKTEEDKSIPFYVEYIGAIDKWKSLLGVKYRAIQELTTYEQALSITNELMEAGIDKLRVEYSGWYKGGLEGAAPSNAITLSELEQGGTSQKEFLKVMEEKNIPVYLGVQLQYVYKDTLFDGYSNGSYAPRYFDKSIVKTGDHAIPNGYISEKNINIISPFYVNKLTEEFLKKRSGLENVGYAPQDLTFNLYSDYLEERYTDRAKAIEYNRQALEILKEKSTYGVLGSNANTYAFSALSELVNVPYDSNRSQLIDQVVPFYGILIHGYLDFAGEPLNICDDYQTNILKTLETGGGIQFQWIYEDNSLLKETDYHRLYSVNYKKWKDQAVELWKELNRVLGPVNNQIITDHEKIENQVYKTTYEDGTWIITNYNRYQVEVLGIQISPLGYAAGKE